MILWKPRTRAGAPHPSGEGGFSLIEMMVATTLFLVGLIAVAQLVPATLLLNLTNRNDTAATTFAQRELVQMLDQPLSYVKFRDDYVDVELRGAMLGDPSSPDTVVGSPVVMDGTFVRMNFVPDPVPGYSLTWVDLNDPTGTVYDVRWAVITKVVGGSPVSKRFIIGVWRKGGNGFALPVTLDGVVQR